MTRLNQAVNHEVTHMPKSISKSEVFTFFILCLIVMHSALVNTAESIELVATESSGVAIKGYDTVAYFTEGKAIKGNPEFTYTWHDAQWQFANAHRRDLFAADPERYAPQFGGFCSNALTVGKVVAADPEQWTIVDGKLYIKYNSSSRDRWRDNKAAKIEQANETWAKYLKGTSLKAAGEN
jgi:hypothetical protein